MGNELAAGRDRYPTAEEYKYFEERVAKLNADKIREKVQCDRNTSLNGNRWNYRRWGKRLVFHPTKSREYTSIVLELKKETTTINLKECNTVTFANLDEVITAVEEELQ